MSPLRNCDSPTPFAAGECSLPPDQRVGGHTRLRLKGWGSPNSDDWRKSLALCLLCVVTHTCSLAFLLTLLEFLVFRAGVYSIASLHAWVRGDELEHVKQWGQFILFSVVFTSPPPSHHGNVWLLPVISLVLTNTVQPVRACLSI
jgi:hypothetical protein